MRRAVGPSERRASIARPTAGPRGTHSRTASRTPTSRSRRGPRVSWSSSCVREARPAMPPPGPGAPLPTWPGRGKLAVCAGTPTVAYVRFAFQGNDQNGGGHAGLFRTHAAPHDAQAASGSAIQWDTIAAAGAADFQGEVG